MTFNSLDSGLSEEEIERVSPCISNTMAWMFDAFDSGLNPTPAKVYDKAIFVADSGEITKVTVILAVAVLAITGVAGVCIATRRLRSKKSINKKDDD